MRFNTEHNTSMHFNVVENIPLMLILNAMPFEHQASEMLSPRKEGIRFPGNYREASL